jgi:hypothetical protein
MGASFLSNFSPKYHLTNWNINKSPEAQLDSSRHLWMLFGHGVYGGRKSLKNRYFA